MTNKWIAWTLISLSCLFTSTYGSVFDATIPVVDMKDYYSPKTRTKFIDGLSNALRDVGFVAVLNPGVDIAALDKAYLAAEQFFGLDFETKMLINDPANHGQRGYVPGETAKGNESIDFKEFLHIGRESSEPNLWPQEMDLKTPMLNLYDALLTHTTPIQEAIALAIGQPKNLFVDMTRKGETLLRALHYPNFPPKNATWAAEHTDIDLFTILPRASCEGLQVKNKKGEWVDVIVPNNAFIINCGDMLENISNGEYRSAEHRVVYKDTGKDRYSMVLFIHPESLTSLNPLAKSIQRTGGVKKYPDANRLELLFERLVDLGLASDEMVYFLAESGIVDRLITMGRASIRVMEKMRDAGCASDAILAELERLSAN